MIQVIRLRKSVNLTELIGSSRILAGVYICAVLSNSPFPEKERFMFIPRDYEEYFSEYSKKITLIMDANDIISEINKNYKRNGYIAVSEGRFITKIEKEFLKEILDTFHEDVIAVNVTPELLSCRERIRFDSNNYVAAFRRYRCDSLRFTRIPDDWPYHVFIKPNVFDKISTLPDNFGDFITICKYKSLQIRSINIGGTVLDLENESDMLPFLINSENLKRYQRSFNGHTARRKDLFGKNHNQRQVRLFGHVLIGNNVYIGSDSVLVGPAIICDNVKIRSRSVIKESIVFPEVSLPGDCRVINNMVKGAELPNGQYDSQQPLNKFNTVNNYNSFKLWPLFSYPCCLKRIADILTSSLVLTIFMPLFLIIPIIIKLTSKGPIFFRDKRQGRYGKDFNCLKFRTMIVGADNMQDKLRLMNQVDGPQFKIENDPRMTRLGKFLRETYIDEIPQFINVLLGQMSLVGPRPSPRKENSLCPAWRDARLSVRPGITGLWQACRTRAQGQDFQEWIHYDIEYVRNISFLLDVSICFKTVLQITSKFIRLFVRND